MWEGSFWCFWPVLARIKSTVDITRSFFWVLSRKNMQVCFYFGRDKGGFQILRNDFYVNKKVKLLYLLNNLLCPKYVFNNWQLFHMPVIFILKPFLAWIWAEKYCLLSAQHENSNLQFKSSKFGISIHIGVGCLQKNIPFFYPQQ